MLRAAMLANQEPIQLQGRPTCMSLALNAFMVMPRAAKLRF